VIEPPEEDQELRKLLAAGGALTASSGGALVGAVIAGPGGAVAGAGVGWLGQQLVDIGSEVARRHLAPRAEQRVGAVFLLASDEVSARIMAGETPREDIRAEVTPGRSPAHELVEATLIAASQSYEERKLPYLAHLLAALPFDADLDLADAHQLIALAESLSYRKLVILAAYNLIDPEGKGRDVMGGFHLRGNVMPGVFEDGRTLGAIRVDLLDLFRLGLLLVDPRRKRGGRPSTAEVPWPAIPEEINPDSITVSDRGNLVLGLMRLDGIPEGDQEEFGLASPSLARGNTRRRVHGA
jgi:hypothetical protein